MPPKTGKRHYINKKSVPEISKVKLHTIVKNKIEMTHTQTNISFDRTKRLSKPSEGARFMIMRKKLDKDGDDSTMRKINPIMLGRLIRGLGGIDNMKLIHDGGLLIKTTNYNAANSLYQIVSIPGFNVVVDEYERLNKSVGVIFDRSLIAATDEEILDELKQYHCKNVKRILKTVGGHKVATGTFFLTFGTINLPSYVTVGYTSHKMTPYVPNPTRCFKCQLFGHVSSSCKSPEKICVNCGMAEHTEVGEKCSNKARCVNCQSNDHNSMSRDCPEYLYRKKIEEIKVNEKKSHVDAMRLLDARDPMANPASNKRILYSSVLNGNKGLRNGSTESFKNAKRTQQDFGNGTGDVKTKARKTEKMEEKIDIDE